MNVDEVYCSCMWGVFLLNYEDTRTLTMYIVSRFDDGNYYEVSMVDLDTLQESTITSKEFLKLALERKIYPNNGVYFIIIDKDMKEIDSFNFYSDEIEFNTVSDKAYRDLKVGSNYNLLTRLDGKQEVLKDYMIYNMTADEGHWRRNNWRLETCGVSVCGDGNKTYIYKDGYIHEVYNVFMILGLMYQGSHLNLRCVKAGTVYNVPINKNSCRCGEIVVMAYTGTIREMYRKALFRV